MRRTVLALLLSAVLLAGCTAPGTPGEGDLSASGSSSFPQSSSTGKVQTDWSVLEGGEEPQPAVFQRWHSGYTDHLIPGKEYGLLLPFAGARVRVAEPGGDSQEDFFSGSLYGLMTRDGKVVMDPVCASIYRISYSDVLGEHALLPVLVMEKGDQKRGAPNGGSLVALAASDGSWCTDFLYWGCTASPTSILAGDANGMYLLAPQTGEVVKQWNWSQLGIPGGSAVAWFTGDAYSSVQWTGDRFFLGCFKEGKEARFLDPVTGEVSVCSARDWEESLESRFQQAPQTWWDAVANGDGTYTLSQGDESYTISSPLDMGEMLPYVSGGDRVIFEDGQGGFAVTDIEGNAILPPREGTLAVLQNDWEDGNSWFALRLKGETLWLIYDWNGKLVCHCPGDGESWCTVVGPLVEIRSDDMAAYYRPEDGSCVLRVAFGLPG